MEQSRKKKILYLITKSNWGGAQRYVFDLANNLPKDSYECVVALGGNGELKTKLTAQGIKVIQIDSLSRDISLLKEFKAAAALFKIIKAENPDVLHINSSKAGGLSALIGRILFVPKIVFTAHGWAFNEDRPIIARTIIKLLHWITVLLAHRTIAVSQTLKKQMNWWTPKSKIIIVHNGRQAPDFLERLDARNQLVKYFPTLNQYQNDFWSVTIGELHPVKNHDVTIMALAKVTSKNQNVRHLIIGAGQEHDNLQKLIEKLNLTDHVFLLGSVDEAADYLKAFDLFVLASRSEGLAYVVIEACFAGLPIITSNVGGLPEILNNEAGLLVDSGSVEKLADTYQMLLHDNEQRLALGIKANLRSKQFTLSKMTGETLSVYNKS